MRPPQILTLHAGVPSSMAVVLASCWLFAGQALAQPAPPATASPSDPAPTTTAPPTAPVAEEPAAEPPAAEAPEEPAPALGVTDGPLSPAQQELAAEPALEADTLEPAGAASDPPPSPEVLAETPPKEEPPPLDRGTPLIVNGSFLTRYELREGYEEFPTLTHPRLHREGDTFVYRARLSFQTQPVDIGGGSSILVKLVPQAAGTHSTQGSPPTIGDVPNLGAYEAFTRLQGDAFTFDVGRFMMNYGDAVVIGDLGWNETARAFQGARFRLKDSTGAYVDMFATLITEGSEATAATFEGDRVFYGAYAGLGPALGDLELDLYLLGQSFGSAEVTIDDTTDPPETAEQQSATFFTLGARIKQAISAFDYRLETGLQLGSSPVALGDARDKLAYHADAELGVTPASGLRLALGGLVASGDSDPNDDKDGAYDELFPTTHKFLGLSDVFGVRSNALGANAEVSYAPSDALVIKLQGHALGRMEENASGETYTGTELDTHIIHRLGKGAAVRAMYAYFVPNDDYWDGVSDPVHYLEVEYAYHF